VLPNAHVHRQVWKFITFYVTNYIKYFVVYANRACCVSRTVRDAISPHRNHVTVLAWDICEDELDVCLQQTPREPELWGK